jgi:arylsulfatase A-like enzyme
MHASLLILPALCLLPVTEISGRPNLVILLADDLGYGDVGAFGGGWAETPRLDRLAAEGVRFSHATSASSSCAPSRLGLMAGAYTQRFGLTWNDDRGAHRLPPGQPLLPELLRGAGYRTGLVGKWNIVRPASAVFDEVHDYIEWESDYVPDEDGRYAGSGPTSGPGVASSKRQGWLTVPTEEDYLTSRLARRGADFIRRHAREPFFLLIGFNATHSPWQGRTQDRGRYDKLPHEPQRIYASMLAALDEAVGVVLDAIAENGLERETMVAFLSDNGPAKGGKHIAGWQADWPRHLVMGNTAGLRGAKTDLFEGGIRTPLILRWPAVLKPGLTYARPVSALDLAPTFATAAGVRVDQGTFDGVDLLPFVSGLRDGHPHLALFWKVKSAAAIRQGDWKLLLLGPDWNAESYNAPSDPSGWIPHLYELTGDPEEMNDLASVHPDKVIALKSAWEQWNANLPPPARGKNSPP